MEIDHFFERVVLFCGIGCAVNGGLFFVFSNTIMTAFSRITPVQSIAAMRSINRVILNPVFFFLFFGTALACLLAVILALRGAESLSAVFGGLIYLIGCFMVTVVRNVPLNDRLERIASESPEAENFWQVYLKDWTRWNHVRTVACLVAAFAFLS